MRCWERFAATTTSWPIVIFVTSSMSSGEVALLISSSFASNSECVKTNVTGNFAEVEIEKFPLSSEDVPAEVPLMVLDAAVIGSIVTELRTVQLMVTVCAKAWSENKTMIRQAAVKRRLLLI